MTLLFFLYLSLSLSLFDLVVPLLWKEKFVSFMQLRLIDWDGRIKGRKNKSKTKPNSTKNEKNECETTLSACEWMRRGKNEALRGQNVNMYQTFFLMLFCCLLPFASHICDVSAIQFDSNTHLSFIFIHLPVVFVLLLLLLAFLFSFWCWLLFLHVCLCDRTAKHTHTHTISTFSSHTPRHCTQTHLQFTIQKSHKKLLIFVWNSWHFCFVSG